MARFRSAWLFGVVLLGAVGVWASVKILSPGGALTVLLTASVVAASMALVVPQDDGPSWRRVFVTGLSWGGAFLAAVGFVALFGRAGVAVLATMTVFSPPVMRWVASWYHRSRGHPAPEGPEAVRSPGRAHDTRDRGPDRGAAASTAEPPPVDAPWMSAALESFDDASLCQAWRTSYGALQRAVSPPRRLPVVQRRQELLDELERRNAEGFSAWLESGARAAGDPSRYIVGARPDHRHDQR